MKDLIIEIYKDDRYKALCKKIAKRSELAEELHSTFILNLLESKHDNLLKAKNEGYFEVYLIGIINRIWNSRSRVKSYETGKTSPLFEYSSTFDISHRYNSSDAADGDKECFNRIDPQEFFSKPDEPYDISIDYVSEKAKEIIEKECDHNDINRMYKARVFKYSYIVHKNPDQFAKKIDIPRASIRYTCKQFQKFLCDKLKLE